ncbi:hypothetical protein EJM73_08455 [Clostridium botulinum]|uniref:hypothetical protein n=1 Tax=Clostridium botulinum TaxID=1491 RepID=UPI0013762EA2|nr:hypothetical protein [Clostridium botulinum]NCI19930.1 hypothetical protein [Clostridium botulinum]NCI35692.1 hypothetical protein [Clostridium botulinum]NCI71825.1 hypothetical protein [Clostridium botulinum]NDI38741.1 hypothetical protein [Clostridium botulinum]HCL4455081.1 hypothetical protein [Clostridium botulinum]
MRIEDLIKRTSKDQFNINNFYNSTSFALTESTPQEKEYERNKMLTIDFGNNIIRHVGLDMLLLVLQEFYGKEFLINSIKQFKSYDEIKDKVIPDI